MVEVSGESVLGRIEDFIALANEGKDVNVMIDLRREFMSRKMQPGDTEELKGAIDIYLLFGNFTFKIGDWEKVVSKAYMMYGSTGEYLNNIRIKKRIANERLKMDYRRMKDVNIHFEEKYF